MLDRYKSSPILNGTVETSGIGGLYETAESKNKIQAFDTTVVRGCGLYEKLVNLYKMKSIVMFRNFIAKKGGNVMIQKLHLTFHRNTERMKMAATPHY